MSEWTRTAVLALSFAWIPTTAEADNFPGDYNPFPAGTLIAGLRYTYSSGDDLYARGESVDDDFHFQDQQAMLTLNYYGGERLRWGVIGALPFGRTEVRSDVLRLDAADTGIGDPHVVAGVWPLIGRNYHLGFSGWLFLPLGSYDPDRPVNQGLNVWSGKAEVNFTWKPDPGWALEVTAASRLFADNDEYGPSRATLERAARNTAETHVVKTVRPGLRVSLDYYYHWGGETTVNGVARDDAWDDHAAQLTVIWRIGSSRVVTGWYRNDFVVNNGPEFQSVGLRLMQLF